VRSGLFATREGAKLAVTCGLVAAVAVVTLLVGGSCHHRDTTVDAHVTQLERAEGTSGGHATALRERCQDAIWGQGR
jgi:hypothetical protein